MSARFIHPLLHIAQTVACPMAGDIQLIKTMAVILDGNNRFVHADFDSHQNLRSSGMTRWHC